MRAFSQWVLLLVLLLPAGAADLTPLRYHHPGLTVDLGVGLWAWPIPWDVDGDGDYDLLVSCPDKPSNGVYFFENITGSTAAHKLPIFKAAVRLSATVPYIMPSYVQGALRVLSPGQEYLHFPRTGITEKQPVPVPRHFYKPIGLQKQGVRHEQWRYADYDGDARPDLIVGLEDWSDYGWDNAYDATGHWLHGPLHGFVFVQRNLGDDHYAEPFQIMAGEQPLDTFGCPSPNFVNFDDDDDLDLLCGEFLDGFTYYENEGTSSEPRYGKAQRVLDASGKAVRMDLEMSVPVAFDWDQDGDADLIVGDEDGRVAFVENLGRVPTGHAPVFAQPVYFSQEADMLKCGALATPVTVDWDGDGDQDIVSGNTAGYLMLFENQSGPNVAEPQWAAPQRLLVNGEPFRIQAGPNGSIQGPAEAKWGYTTLSAADWNGDGRPDLIVNSILGEVVWLQHLSTGLAAPQPLTVAWVGAAPALAWGWRQPQGNALLTQWRTTPLVADFNHDGRLDLAMLDTEGYLAFFERNATAEPMLKAPRRAFLNAQGQPLRLNEKTAGASGRRKLCVTDWNQDEKFDLLLNSANAEVLLQTSATADTWTFTSTGNVAQQNIEGHDVSPTTCDFDGDGTPDFLGGAEDGRLYFLKHPPAPAAAGVQLPCHHPD